MNDRTESSVEIRPVSDKSAMDSFIRVPWEIYKDDPNWVPPLLIERKEAFSNKNPFFSHAHWRAWIALRDGKALGRISAQVDDLHQQIHTPGTGFFGLLEAPDDPGVFAALFEVAENWLSKQGMQRMVGPFSLGINQEIGVLIEGFNTPPYVMMGHSPAYYGPSIAGCGLEPAQDLLAYEVNMQTMSIPSIMQALIDRSTKRVTVRCLQRDKVATELELMRDIFNDAWQNNWNFVPFTPEEFKAVGKELLMLLPSDLIQIAELDGKAVAFIVMIPNINEAIADLNGHLLPFGWVKLLWRLKMNFPTSARVALMGVRQQYQNTRIGPALAFLVINAVMQAGLLRGVIHVEMSWILEHNKGVRNIIESLGGKITKRYRMYEKAL